MWHFMCCLFVRFYFGDIIVIDLILVENDVSSCLWLGDIVLGAKGVCYRLIQGGSKKPLRLNWLWVKLLEYIKAGLQNKQISKRASWPANELVLDFLANQGL